MQDFKTRVHVLVGRGLTKTVIANLTGIFKTELATLTNGGRLTPAKEGLVVHFLDRLEFALQLVDEDPTLSSVRLDLKDGNFVRKLVEAADIVRRERQREVERATAGIAECRRQIEEASPVR
jgi:hypothetical protein